MTKIRAALAAAALGAGLGMAFGVLCLGVLLIMAWTS